MTNNDLDALDQLLDNQKDCLTVDDEKATSMLKFEETAIEDPFLFKGSDDNTNTNDNLDQEC